MLKFRVHLTLDAADLSFLENNPQLPAAGVTFFTWIKSFNNIFFSNFFSKYIFQLLLAQREVIGNQLYDFTITLWFFLLKVLKKKKHLTVSVHF